MRLEEAQLDFNTLPHESFRHYWASPSLCKV